MSREYDQLTSERLSSACNTAGESLWDVISMVSAGKGLPTIAENVTLPQAVKILEACIAERGPGRFILWPSWADHDDLVIPENESFLSEYQHDLYCQAAQAVQNASIQQAGPRMNSLAASGSRKPVPPSRQSANRSSKRTSTVKGGA